MCANGNLERRNHCVYTREPGAAEPRLCVLKLIFEMCANGNPERRNHCAYTLEPGAAEPRLCVLKLIFEMCANGNPKRRNHCAYTREPGAAEPRLSHGVALCDPDILYWWRHWYNMSDLLDEQGELYTLEVFGAEELARVEEETKL
ncbi:hypothetical protein RHMOL_Rhmol05G0191200 [Rhododendron molle]|uniref:Uncharacterized protein n=1 Tax=Rhododendron molle TaxID=49168 RepID=A0ACC0NQV3_RHOML|nr:hypothetical protein RHMOL_Rhmol05G0191200 [Rhododendron molle]